MFVLLLFQLFLYFQLINGDEKEPFNEALLMNHHHQNVQKANSFIERFRPKTNANQKLPDKPKLRTIEYKQNTKAEFLDYDITNIWWNDTMGEDHEITPQFSFLTTPYGHGMFPADTTTSLDEYTPRLEHTIPKELQDLYGTTKSTEKSNHLPAAFITRPSFPISASTQANDHTTPENYTETPVHPQYPYLTPPKGFPPDFKFPTAYPLPPGHELVPSKTKLTPKYPLFTLPDIPDRPIPSVAMPTFGLMTTQSKTHVDTGEWTTPEITHTSPEMTFTTLLPKISELIKDYIKEHTIETIDPIFGRTNPGLRQHPRSLRPRKDSHLRLASLRTSTKSASYTGLGYIIFGNITVSTSPVPTTIPYQDILEQLREGYMVAALTELMAIIALKDPTDVHDVVANAQSVVDIMLSEKTMGFLGFPLEKVILDLADYASSRAVHIIQNHATLTYHLLLARRTELSAEVNSIIDYANGFYGPYDGKNLIDAVKDFENYPTSSISDPYLVCENLIRKFFAPYFRIVLEPRQILADSINKAIQARFLQYQKKPWAASEEFTTEPSTTTQDDTGTITQDNTGTTTQGDAETTQDETTTTQDDTETTQDETTTTQDDTETTQDETTTTTTTTQDETTGTTQDETKTTQDETTTTQDETTTTPDETTSPNFMGRRKPKITQKPKRRNYQRHRKSNLRLSKQRRNSNRRQYRPNTETEFPMLRSLKPITSQSTIQRRYHIVTSKYHFRQMVVKPTTRHYVNLMTRPTKPMIRYYKERYRSKTIPTEEITLVNKVNYRRKINNDDDKATIEVVGSRQEVEDKTLFYHQMKERFKALHEAKSGKLKAELLRKVVEGSSYSDEEADLKMKLVQALLLGNRSEVRSDRRQ